MRLSHEPQDTSDPYLLAGVIELHQKQEFSHPITVTASAAKVLEKEGWHVISDSDLGAGGEI
ncbi:MAG: hypothetical protein NTZ13_01850 [Candidatus Parcubacteria bacterium]|nr:hypothetical protein [Candidatus Parcubacteria bacterium]